MGPVRKIEKLLTRTLKPTNQPTNAGVITLSHIGRVIRQIGVLEHVGCNAISHIGKVLRQMGVLELEGVITISRIGKVLRKIGMMDHSVHPLSIIVLTGSELSHGLCLCVENVKLSDVSLETRPRDGLVAQENVRKKERKDGYSPTPHLSKLKTVIIILHPTGHHSTPEQTQLIFQSITVSQPVRL